MNYLLTLILIIATIDPSLGRNPLPAKRFESLSGRAGDEVSDIKGIWDKKYSKKSYIYGKSPEKFLSDNYHYIPQGSRVLDVGMGEGRHAVYLAQKGYKVTGIDISTVALKKAKELAREFKVRIETIRGDVPNYSLKKEKFDAIICFYYVDKQVDQKLREWLKPGGILIYEAHTTKQLKVKGFERHNKAFMLKPGELLKLFPKMKILKYEEPLHEDTFRASIILMK